LRERKTLDCFKAGDERIPQSGSEKFVALKSREIETTYFLMILQYMCSMLWSSQAQRDFGIYEKIYPHRDLGHSGI
jgi:hypothetical protein